MPTVPHELLVCWFGPAGRRCTNAVSGDPDDLGLCDDHREQLRDENYWHKPLTKKSLPAPIERVRQALLSGQYGQTPH